ncbi:MAG: hypothetical protein HKN13_15545 [Rhodothermales bacterium]|nr:hypothetical protein [Rhodothermales bacterium]
MTSPKRIGVLTIGQTPREDLLALLWEPGDSYRFEVRGALDGLSEPELAVALQARVERQSQRYPLVTQLSDSTHVTIEESTLIPLIQDKLEELDGLGVAVHILLCAGPFEELVSRAPLIRPFRLGSRTMAAFGFEKIAVVVPTNNQEEPARLKWLKAGFEPVVWSLERIDSAEQVQTFIARMYNRESDGAEAVVFDYVGYPRSVLHAVREEITVPVIDLGELSVAALQSLIG